MKYQTNESLGPFINHWGCHICSILEKVEKLSVGIGKPFKFSNSDVGAVYITAMRHGAVQQEITKDGKPFDGCSVLDGAGLFNIACQMFDLPIEATGYRKETNDYVCKDNEEEVLELKRAGYNGSHFVAGNKYGGIEFDPIEGGSVCAARGWVESKRVLTWRKK